MSKNKGPKKASKGAAKVMRKVVERHRARKGPRCPICGARLRLKGKGRTPQACQNSGSHVQLLQKRAAADVRRQATEASRARRLAVKAAQAQQLPGYPAAPERQRTCPEGHVYEAGKGCPTCRKARARQARLDKAEADQARGEWVATTLVSLPRGGK